MKGKWIILIVGVCTIMMVYASTESYWDALTKGYADTLYCSLDDGCGTSTTDDNSMAVVYIGADGEVKINASLIASGEYAIHSYAGEMYLYTKEVNLE